MNLFWALYKNNYQLLSQLFFRSISNIFIQMRLLLVINYGILQRKTERIDIPNSIENTQLLSEFFEKRLERKPHELIIHVLKEHRLKIINGWPLEIYGLSDGDQIEIKVLEFELESMERKYKNKYIMTLLDGRTQKKLEKITQEEHEQKQQIIAKNIGGALESVQQSFNPQAYLDSELELMLKQVQRGNLKQFMQILEQVPNDLNEELTLQLEIKKPQLINTLGQRGWGLIHYAVYSNQIDIVKELVRRNADINKSTDDGWLPLQIAINRKNYQLLKILLLQRSININECTIKGTALHVASRSNDIQSIKLLLQNNIDTNLRDHKGDHPSNVTTNETCKNLILQYEKFMIGAKKEKKEFFLPSKIALLKGSVFKIRTLLLNLTQRYLVLNPFEGTLIRYDSQACYPKKPTQVIPILNIKAARIVKKDQKSWHMKKEMTYFEIYTPNRLIMACRHQKIAEKWIRGIYDSVLFVTQIERNKTLRETIQRCELFLDDINGEIIDTKNIKVDTKKDILINNQARKKQGSSILQAGQRMHTQSADQSGLQLPKPTITTSSFVDTVKNQNQISTIMIDPKLINTSIESTPIQNQKQLTSQLENLTNDYEQITNFSSFQILEVLGAGSFGKVFLVKHIDSKNIYALKALKKKTLVAKKQLKYAIAEATVLKKTNNPFIINLYYAFQTPNYLYLTLDYCPGKDMSFHLAQQVLFPEDQARFYICELLLALQHLHDKNIIYRDLKPQNILIDKDGHIKLADFGLSKDTADDKTRSFCGSPAYLSPEMLNQKVIGKQSDLYGLGCVFYEFLVGQPPYYSDDIPQLYKNIKEAKLKFPKSISDEARSLLIGLLQREPKKRLGSKSKDEIKKHEFFKGIDWEDVFNKKLNPPIRKANQPKQIDSDDEIKLEKKVKVNFTDTDYQQPSKRTNRIVNFSFVKQSQKQISLQQ